MVSHHVASFLALVVVGCTAVAETPAAPAEVVALAGAYEQPTAMLTDANARAVVDRTVPLREVLQAVRGLQFIRDIVEDATSIRDADIDAIAVDGALDARSACPGWDPTLPPDQAIDGRIEVTIGVEESRVQRAFGGRAIACRFVTLIAGQLSNGVATMDLEVDLGGSLGLGEPAPSILVRATNVSGSVGPIALNLGPQVLSFRLREDASIDTLVDAATLGTGLTGSLLLAVRTDGTVSVQGQNGTWVCGLGGSACTRAAGA